MDVSPLNALSSDSFDDWKDYIDSLLMEKQKREAQMRANYALGARWGYKQKIAPNVDFRFFPSVIEFQNMLTRAYIDDERGRQIWGAIKDLDQMQDIVKVPNLILWEILRSGVMLGTDRDSILCCHAVVTWAWSQNARLVAMVTDDLLELLSPDSKLPVFNLFLMLNGVVVGLENEVILHILDGTLDFQNSVVQQLMPEEEIQDIEEAICKFLARKIVESQDILNDYQNCRREQETMEREYLKQLLKTAMCWLHVCLETRLDCVQAAGHFARMLLPAYVALSTLEKRRNLIHLIASVSPLLCFAVCLQVLDEMNPMGRLWNKCFPGSIADVFLSFTLIKPELEMQSRVGNMEVVVELKEEELMLLFWAMQSYKDSRRERQHVSIHERMKVKDFWYRDASTCRLLGRVMPKWSKCAMGAGNRSQNYIVNIRSLAREYVLGGVGTCFEQ